MYFIIIIKTTYKNSGYLPCSPVLQPLLLLHYYFNFGLNFIGPSACALRVRAQKCFYPFKG